MFITVIVALAFVSVVILILGLTLKSEQDLVADRMQKNAEWIEGSIETTVQESFADRIVRPFLRRLSGIGLRLTPGGAIHEIEQKLETAGNPWHIGAAEFLGFKVLTSLAGVLLGMAAFRYVGISILLRGFAAGLIILIGVFLPEALLQNRILTRQSSIRKTLPDTLDLLTVSVEAGLGLDGAFQTVIKKLNHPLANEMNRALQEMRAGMRRDDALRNMALRAKVMELSTFVATLCQAEQLGVSIAKVLRSQGESIRSMRSHKAREAAAKLPVRMLFPLVFCIFPALFVVVLAPGAIQIGRALGILK